MKGVHRRGAIAIQRARMPWLSGKVPDLDEGSVRLRPAAEVAQQLRGLLIAEGPAQTLVCGQCSGSDAVCG